MIIATGCILCRQIIQNAEGHDIFHLSVDGLRLKRHKNSQNGEQALRQQISWNPACAHITPLGTRSSSPGGVEIHGDKEKSPVFIAESKVRKEGVAWLQDVELNLDPHRFSNVGSFNDSSGFAPNPNGPESSGFVTRGAGPIWPLAGSRGGDTRVEVSIGDLVGRAVELHFSFVEQDTAGTKPRDRLHVVRDK